ncbi:MAG: transferase [Verrucomicrobia bacterium]|nr:transferase [Verrucomicrobiota bacterium]
MKPKLLIVGAGGLGREVLAWALARQEASGDWEVGGFLDANPRAIEGTGCGLPILGDPSGFRPSPDHRFVGAVGDPATRLGLCEELRRRGARFVSVIHPSALVGESSRVGEGAVICPGAIVSVNATIGDFVVLNMNATVGHDAVIGAGCTIGCHADVTGTVSLARGVLLGNHATVLPGVVVGDYAVVGAGSVVVRNVAARTTVIGVPGRTLLRPNPEEMA